MLPFLSISVGSDDADGVDRRRAPRRKVAGREDDGEEAETGDSERRRVVPADPEQEVPERRLKTQDSGRAREVAPERRGRTLSSGRFCARRLRWRRTPCGFRALASRWATELEMSPYTPTIPKSRAIALASVSSRVMKRVPATDGSALREPLERGRSEQSQAGVDLPDGLLDQPEEVGVL